MFAEAAPVHARRSVLRMLGAMCLQSALPRPEVRTYSVGSTATGFPFTFLDMKTNRLSGAMVEIMATIAADAGFRTETSVMSFAALVPSLLGGKIDIICAAILRTGARAQVVDFTEPVYSYGGGLVVAGSDTRRYVSIDDLRGRIAGVQMGTLYGEQARAAGAKRVVYYDSLPDVLHDLHAGRIDAAYGDAPILAYQTSVLKSASLALRPAVQAARARRHLPGRQKRQYTAAALDQRVDRTTQAHRHSADSRSLEPRLTELTQFLQDALQFLPLLVAGAGVTLLLTVCALLVSILLGFLWATMRMSPRAALRVPASMIIHGVRGVPILVQLFYVYFVLPDVGIRLNAFVSGVAALGLAYSVYQAENFRAGFTSIDPSLIETAHSLGMTEWVIMRRVRLPLALRVILPPFGNTAIMLLKDSSIASTITVVELTRAGQLVAVSTFKNMTVYTLVAVLYLAMSLPLSYLTRTLERRLARR